MLLVAQEGAQEFLRVQGLHAMLPHLFVTGNRPDPGWETVLFGLASGAVYLLLALAASLRFERRDRGEGRRRWGWRVLLFLGFFAAWELSLQAWSAGNPYETFVPDPARFWTGRADSGPRQLHAERVDGLFDTQYLPQRTPGRYRIFFMGDSQAISLGPDRYGGDRTYPKVLGESAQGPNGEPVEAINGGISGYSSWQGLLLLRSVGVGYQPDLVVAGFGYHDSTMAFSPDAEAMTDDPRVHLLRSILYRSKVYLLVRQVLLRRQGLANLRKAERARVPRVSVPEFEANLRAMVALGRQHGFRVAVLWEPFRDPHVGYNTREYREAVQRVDGVAVLDLYTPIAALTPEERARLFDDAIHLTEEGHRTAARLAAEELRKAGLLR